MTRIASVNAETVAIRSSGQMIVVMTDAGTTIPPIPKPLNIRRPHRVFTFVCEESPLVNVSDGALEGGSSQQRTHCCIVWHRPKQQFRLS